MNKEQQSGQARMKESNSADAHLQRSISRRNLLMSAAALGAGAKILETADTPAETDPPESKPKILALIGDKYHNADYIHVALDRLFSEMGLAWDYTATYERFSRNSLRGYRILVFFKDGMIWPGGYLEPNDYSYSRDLENPGNFPKPKPQGWITQEQAEAIRDFVSEGNGLYSFHQNCDVSNFSPVYKELLKGEYAGHPPLRPFKVRVVNRTHPITQGVEDFMVTDEQHFPAYYGDRKKILLQGDNIDGLTLGDRGTKSVSGWAHEYGNGRVVFTGIGHTIHALWVPEHLKLQKRAVQWLLKEI
jgi:type 1 glutamine amidotransferase